MARGRKAKDTGGWQRPGGRLPAKVAGLSDLEAKHYDWFREAVEVVGMCGRVDMRMVILAAEWSALCESLKQDLAALPSKTVKNAAGGTVMNPLYAELSRARNSLRDCLAALYLTPRARGSARPTSEEKAGAQGQDETPEALLRILG